MKRSLIVIVTFLSFFLMCNGVKAGENDNYDSNRDSYACANENVFSELLQRDSKYGYVYWRVIVIDNIFIPHYKRT